jgi:hypothetical protein
MMLLLVYYINVETGSVLMSKEARMTPLHQKVRNCKVTVRR